ncbi:hypothetical protein KDA23_05885 [Candidatus Saccharibacteria bacterium]|nr:hypothetical protein [Candidatus Saccharibacteria bacterium]
MKPSIPKLAIEFIKADIEREIRLASLSEKKTYGLAAKLFRLPYGGGNFMCAMGLMCYTEFFGKQLGIKRGSRGNFDSFFAKLGKPYEELIAEHKIYDIFRCGLAHEYLIKKPGTIYMFGDVSPALGFTESGDTYFVVEQYYKDLMAAAEREFVVTE